MICLVLGFICLIITNYFYERPHSYEDILKLYLQDTWGLHFWFTFLICRFPIILIAVGGLMSLHELRKRYRNKEKTSIGIKHRSLIAKLELWFLWLGFFALIYVLIGLAFCVSDFHF